MVTGTAWLCGPVTTLTLSIVPPPSGSPTLAIAFGSPVRLAFAEANTMAPTATTATTTSTPAST
jgi:hypothetical protein